MINSKANKKMIMIIFGVSLLYNSVLAQKELIFKNPQTDEVYRFESTDYMKVQYYGYLNQPTEFQNTIMSITDSSVVFVNAKAQNHLSEEHEVLTSDITGFRKIWKYKPIALSLINLGVGLGTYFAISKNDRFNDTQKLLYSTGAVLVTSYLLNYIFDDNIKFKISDGWQVRVGVK